MYDRHRVADDERSTLRIAVVYWQFSQASDPSGGGDLLGFGCPRRPGGKKHSNRAKFALGSSHYEKILCPDGGPGGLDFHRHHWADKGNYHL